MERVARCGCGQLTATCRGEPLRVSVCHCLACQRRTGGAFSAQARFPVEAVTIAGEVAMWEKAGDSGKVARFRRCPTCGGTLFWDNEGYEGNWAIPLGAFAGGDMPVPMVSLYEERKLPWLAVVGDGIEHVD